MAHLALAAISWDPQLRGALIVLAALLILPGSVYLLLSTNLGMKVGLLVAIAGLSGWLLLLNVLWLVGPLGNGPIGYKGVSSGWDVKEIVTGDLVTHSGLKAIVGTPGRPSTQFPSGWAPLVQGNPLLASAAPAADTALIPPPPGSTQKRAFPPPFKLTQDYVLVTAYTRGGHNYLFNLFGYKVYWRIRHHYIYVKHQPRYVVVRVAPSLPSVTLNGAAATLPAPDLSQPPTNVVLLHNVGSLRLPPILLGFGSFIIFALACEQLHHRDRELARRREEGDGGGGSGPPSGAPTRPAGELQPA
jgi:hypothetical protein